MTMYPNEALEFNLKKYNEYSKLTKYKFQFKHIVLFFSKNCDYEVGRKATL